MSQIEPKRCPVCKSNNVEVIFDTETKNRTIMATNPYSSLKVTFRYNVKCISCGLMLDKTYLTRMKAVEVWNTTSQLAIPVWRRVFGTAKRFMK